MARRPAYSLDTNWVDPFEQRVENRQAERFPFTLKISMAVEAPTQKGQLVGPGIIRDVSLTGVSVVTKHQLVPRQKVTVAIPAKSSPEGLCLPRAFIGPAEVRRVEPHEGTKSIVALKFGDSLIQNIEFVMYLDYMRMTTRTLALKQP